MFLLAAFPELIDGIRVPKCIAQAILAILPAILRFANLLSVLLAYKTCDRAVRDRALTARGASANLCIKVDHASSTLKRVSPEAVRLMAVLVKRYATLSNICILGINILVATSVDGGQAFRSDECTSAFVVVYAISCHVLRSSNNFLSVYCFLGHWIWVSSRLFFVL